MMLYVLDIVIMNSTGVVSLKNRVQNRVREHHKVAVLGYGTGALCHNFSHCPVKVSDKSNWIKKGFFFAFL